MSCTLTISGTAFDVDAFIAETEWSEKDKADMQLRIYKKGEYVNQLKRHVNPYSGFRAVVSEADFSDFEQQEKDVIAFLEKHTYALKLSSKYKVDGWRHFNFGLDAFASNKFVENYTLSPKLISLCGEAGMGIEISSYLVCRKTRRRGRAARKFSFKRNDSYSF